MPVIPKFRSTATPSGKPASVAGPWPGYMTGEAREKANFGEVAGNIANEWGQRVRQAYIQNEISQYENQTASDWNTTWDGILRENNPDNQQAALSEFEKRARTNIKPMSRTARQFAHKWLNEKMPQYQSRVLAQGRAKTEQALIGQYDLAVDNAIKDELDDGEELERISGRLQQLGIWTPEQAELNRKNATYAINKQRIQDMAMRAGVQEGTEIVRGSGLEEEDQRQILNLMHSMERFDRYQEQEAKGEFQLQIMQMDLNTPVAQVLEEIKRGPLTVPEQDQLLRSFMFRQEAVFEKGQKDPLVSRRNNDLYWEMLKQAEDGTLDIARARAAVGYDPQNPETTGIAIKDYQEFKNIIENTSARAQAGLKVEMMREMNGFFDDMRAGAFGSEKELEAIRAANLKARQIYEDRIEAAKEDEKPLSREDMMLEMLRVYRQVKDEVDQRRTAEQILPTGLGEGVEGQTSSWPAVDLRKYDTDEERLKAYNSVPEGQLYRKPDGTVARKGAKQ